MKCGDLVYVLMPSGDRFNDELGIFMGKTKSHDRRYGGQEPIALCLVLINNRIGTYYPALVKEIES
jgi:hypothetical protein